MKLFRSALCLLLALLPLLATAAPDVHAKAIASLIDPRKLATLAERGANPRVQKYVAQLALAKRAGKDPDRVSAEATQLAGMAGEAALLTVETMVRNLRIAESLGCLDANGLRDMQRGQSPTIMRGPYQADQLSVDHIIPRKVVPELDKVIANLELMPMRLNAKKSAGIGDRQVSLAKMLNSAGLLSPAGLKAVLSVRPRP